MAAGVAEKFFLSFQDVFWNFSSRCLPLTSSGKIQRKTNCIRFLFLGLKDLGDFRGRQERSRFLVVPFAISANFGFKLSVKIYARKSIQKWRIFGWYLAQTNSEFR